MYDAVVARLSVCALVMLSGCALIGYDLSGDTEPEAGRTGDGSAGRDGTDADAGAATTPAGRGGADGGTSGGAGRGGNAGTDGAGSGGSESDAALDAGGGLDASDLGDGGGMLLPDPCPGLVDGTPCDVNAFCRSHMTCSGGVCVGSVDRDCTALDVGCQHGVCIDDERRCVAKDVADGTDCGAGQTCLAGVCRTNQSCAIGQSCFQGCDGMDCHFDCEGAAGCTIGCGAGSDCDIDCRGADSCAPTCMSADCKVDCRDTGSCDAICSDSTCRIRCASVGDCNAIVCADGASCVIECDGGNCDYQVCATNDVQQCPGDVLVCNGVCP